jgi:[ribosomal protein S5]-alanine N-acetyltransferase
MDVISGPRVMLRDFAMSDLPAVRDYWLHSDVRMYFPSALQESISPESTTAYLQGAIEASSAKPRMRYELAVTVKGQVIGAGRIECRDEPNRSGDIGYVIRRDSWGSGYGTEVTSLLLRLGFDYLGLHRVWATVHPQNTPSIRVLEKAGFSYEGHLRETFRMPDGWRDSLLYAVIEDDRANNDRTSP